MAWCHHPKRPRQEHQSQFPVSNPSVLCYERLEELVFLHTRPSPLLRLHVDIYIGQYCHWDGREIGGGAWVGAIAGPVSRLLSLGSREGACWGRESEPGLPPGKERP